MQVIEKEIKLNQVLCGKSEEQLKKFPDNFFDGIITDPPYGMGFMGKNWDTFFEEKKVRSKTPGDRSVLHYDLSFNGQKHFQSYFYKIAVEMLRTAKPGSFLLCFGGTRTYHRVICALEDSSWQIRDQMMWLYGEGFPKSTNISKQIDKEAGVERKVVGKGVSQPVDGWLPNGNDKSQRFYPDITVPATNDAKRWDGYGTGLKPGWEPIIVAMKPLEKGLTYAQNAKKWGVAGLNIDGGRITTNDEMKTQEYFLKVKKDQKHTGWKCTSSVHKPNVAFRKGRWPANVILSHSPDCICVGTKDEQEVYACVPDCPIRIMDGQSGKMIAGKAESRIVEDAKSSWKNSSKNIRVSGFGDSGGASRFFYCAKAKRSEKEAGLIEFVECVKCGKFNSKTHTIIVDGEKKKEKCCRNSHPTVKPLDLMRYLINLIKMPNENQVILDPFCGSGTTLVACEQLGINYIGIDQDSDSCLISIGRIGE